MRRCVCVYAKEMPVSSSYDVLLRSLCRELWRECQHLPKYLTVGRCFPLKSPHPGLLMLLASPHTRKGPSEARGGRRAQARQQELPGAAAREPAAGAQAAGRQGAQKCAEESGQPAGGHGGAHQGAGGCAVQVCVWDGRFQEGGVGGCAVQMGGG